MSPSWLLSRKSWWSCPDSGRYKVRVISEKRRFCHQDLLHKAGRCSWSLLGDLQAWDPNCKGSSVPLRGSSLCMPHTWWCPDLCLPGRQSSGHLAERRPYRRYFSLLVSQSCETPGSFWAHSRIACYSRSWRIRWTFESGKSFSSHWPRCQHFHFRPSAFLTP